MDFHRSINVGHTCSPSPSMTHIPTRIRPKWLHVTSATASHRAKPLYKTAQWLPECIQHSKHQDLLLPPSATAPPAEPPTAVAVSSRDPDLDLPRHWQEQLKKAPWGKQRVLQRYCQLVKEVNLMEPKMLGLSDEQLQARTGVLKQRLAAGSSLDDLLVEAFAVVREASRRVLGLRHFDSQLLGAMVLHEGQIAEMQTGEGKTLMATLAVYLNALTGKGVHVVTVNDYLAARDVGWMGKLYRFLGLTCAAVQSNMSTKEYQTAFKCDVTYVTGQELCFDYLRDNTEKNPNSLIMPSELNFAVVDEVDSILIDESRNPMIVSVPVTSSPTVVKTVNEAVSMMYEAIAKSCSASSKQLTVDRSAEIGTEYKKHFMDIDKKQKSISLTSTGIAFLVNALKKLGVQFKEEIDEATGQPNEAALWQQEVPWGQMAVTSIRAHEFYKNGVEYIVRDGRVYIIDESTGRVRMSSRYNGGMHQAIEAKERLEVQHESVASSSITFQVFFRFYSKLAGMTGTAQTAAAELYEIYQLRVVQVPTARPCIRLDHAPSLFLERLQKYCELTRVVEECVTVGRPVLIGTTSVIESEEVKHALQNYSYQNALVRSKIQVLNAKPENVRTEAQIIAQAGLPGQVTIATNMAGRGTDIILGGNPYGLTKLGLIRLLYKPQIDDPSEMDCVPRMPLPIFDLYDSDAGSLPQAMEWTEEESGQGRQLPRELHIRLYQAMLISRIERSQNGKKPFTYEDAQTQADHIMDMAEKMKIVVVTRLTAVNRFARFDELSYSDAVCPVVDQVLVEMESLYLEEAPGQRVAVKAALYLWLWFEQQCVVFARKVKGAKGLLVIGTSVQESQRIELQLRGRAGRQGDPGETLMMYDIEDPLLTVMGALRQLVLVPGVRIEQTLVEQMVHNVQRMMENIYQMARLETKQYDEVMEGYRHNLYTLRRMILLGTPQQRTQLIFLFIQHWVDNQVGEKLDANQPPAAWLKQKLVKQDAGPNSPPEVLSSPLEDVLRGVQQLVNPEGVVSKTLVEFSNIKDGATRNSTAESLLKLLGLSQPKRGVSMSSEDEGTFGDGLEGADGEGVGEGARKSPRLPVQILEIEVLSQDQIASLARYLLQDEELQWVRPRVPITLSLRTAISRHRRLVGSVRSTASGGGAGDWVERSVGELKMSSRRPVTGRHSEKVEALRDCLGEALICAYELRKLSLRKALMSQQVGMLDMDADIHLAMYEQRLMLEWMDALWSAFLEDMERGKRAVQVKSFGNLSPLEEFRLEANRSFLAMLDMFREAVVEKLFTPSFEMEFLFEEWDS